ncbi:hypothetical protein GA0070624_4246 [Micromonospora rhizosphaerae]|uniref:Uncharacterized protein n=2 Tax=Micromonospora rhizosphaerae TaxID=568872 RepID=A0A1C6SPV7_9ACTN|nr:hypothetical protein GA0070624_4246 [Micromonospora rhizosphaerae]
MDQGYVVSRVATTEDATSVVVHVSIRPRRLSWSVGDDTVERQIEVWLDGPLAYRQVIDGHSGNPVPER